MSKKKYIVTGIILVVFIVILSILIGVFKNKEMKKGPLDEMKMQEVKQKVLELIDEDKKNYDCYAGMYEENQNLVLLLVKNKEAGSELMDYVESEDGITVRYVKYSLVELQNIQKELRSRIDVDPKHYEYYAGMYEENQKIVLVLVKNKEVGSDLMDYVESEEAIIVRYAKYSWVELNDKFKEITKKYNELQKEGKPARDLRDSGYEGEIIDEKKNRVVVKFLNMSNKKVREFKKIFGDSEMVCYVDSEKYHEELYEELGRPYFK